MTPVVEFCRQRGWQLSIVLLALTLGACGHLRERSDKAPADWPERAARLASIDSWYVQGRLGVRSTDQGGSLDVLWNQQAGHYQMRLLAPMGQGAFFIDGDARGVSLLGADGELRTAASAQQLFAETLGVSLPLTSLQRWLRGLPGADAHELQWDAEGHLYILQEQGWRVEITRYQKVDGIELPHAFFLSRADQPELMIRLILRSWQLRDLPAFEP